MTRVTVHQAKTQLSKLIARALAGEEIVIARGATPVVRIVPVDQPEPGRRFGALAGRLQLTTEFFEPLPADEIAAWQQ